VIVLGVLAKVYTHLQTCSYWNKKSPSDLAKASDLISGRLCKFKATKSILQSGDNYF
jgi:hypothetical protein